MGSRWWWVIGWAILIEGLLLWPSPPDVPSAWSVPGVDKAVHMALFGMQAWLAVPPLKDTRRPVWIALVGTIVFGVLTEWQQQFVPGRAMELGDLAADSVGAMLGVLFAVSWAPRRRESQR